jgi:circadian clock protein KaiB
MSDEFAEDLAEIEAALVASHTQQFRLRLYVIGSGPRSIRAVSNTRALCETHLAGRYDLQVIDLNQRPELARQEQLLAAPTLVREQPEPVRKMVGDMSNLERVLHGLDIE